MRVTHRSGERFSLERGHLTTGYDTEEDVSPSSNKHWLLTDHSRPHNGILTLGCDDGPKYVWVQCRQSQLL